MNILSSCLLAVLAAVPAAAQSAKPQSCGEPGQALERAFVLKLPGRAPMTMIYDGCSWAGRNDYLSGYTERDYKGQDGYELVIVTNHGDGAFVGEDETKASDVLVAKGKTWVAKLPGAPNAKLLSGAPVSVGDELVWTSSPALAACEANLPKPVYGPNQLWLLTGSKAYYYRQDCDICAELDSCDLATGVVKSEITAHSVSCSDLDQYRAGKKVLFDSCAK